MWEGSSSLEWSDQGTLLGRQHLGKGKGEGRKST